jgi:hypothetical protein
MTTGPMESIRTHLPPRGHLVARCIVGPLFGIACGLLLAAAVHPEPQQKDWRLLFSGEALGMLAPCGCTEPQIGGMPRQAALIRKFGSDKRAVAVSNGDLIANGDEQSELKLSIYMRYFEELKYAAINVGEKDLAFGIDHLQMLQMNHRVTFVSGNLLDDKGNRPFVPFGVREDSGQRLIAIGSISPTFADEVERTCPGCRVGPVEPVLEEAHSALQEGDVAVLLYHGDKKEAVEIAKQAPWLCAIVYAHSGDRWSKPETVGKVLLVHGDSQGMDVGEIRIVKDGASAVQHSLTPDLVDDPISEGIRDMYAAELKSRDLLEKAPRRPLPEGASYVGSAACEACHGDFHETWKASIHAHALATLSKLKHDYDPECVGCHTIGFWYEAGFRTPEKTPQLADVGCESCHGPGGQHIDDWQHSMAANGEAACKPCHTIDNSPNFEFKKYWDQIKH